MMHVTDTRWLLTGNDSNKHIINTNNLTDHQTCLLFTNNKREQTFDREEEKEFSRIFYTFILFLNKDGGQTERERDGEKGEEWGERGR